MRARKGVDKFVTKQKPDILDPTSAVSQTAQGVAAREIRRSMNKLIAGSTKDVRVKKSLAFQSNLFSASENIAAKAADQNVAILQKAANNLGKAVGFKGTLSTSAAFVGLGAVPVGAAIGTAAAAVGARSLLLSKGSKKFAAKLLRASDKAIRTVKDPATLRQIRADRAAVIELLKTENGK